MALPTPPDRPATPEDRNSARAAVVRDAVEHSIRVEREAARPQRVQRSRAGRIVLVVVCCAAVAASGYSWFAKPEFIWGPRPREMNPVRSEASMRVAMFLVAHRLEAWREDEGEYPERLSDVVTDSGYAYARPDDTTWVLEARAGGRVLRLRSDDDWGRFLGNSRELIQESVR